MSATEDLLEAIRELPLEEQRRLLSALTESIRHDTALTETRRVIPVDEIRGIAKPEGQPPSDEEIKESYIEYVSEKYP